MKYVITRALEVGMILGLLYLAGCANTLHGAGSLVKGLGQDWQDAAQTQYDTSAGY